MTVAAAVTEKHGRAAAAKANKKPSLKAAVNGHAGGDVATFRALSLKALLPPAIATTAGGKLHLASLATVGDLLDAQPRPINGKPASVDRFSALDVLVDANFSSHDAKQILHAVEAHWRKLGLEGEPWPVRAAPAAGRRPPVELAIGLDWIKPSPLNPRKEFDQAGLEELARSIKAYGVLQPIMVRPTYQLGDVTRRGGNGHGITPETYHAEPANFPTMNFELIAGERRYRAAKLAGLERIPAKVHQLSDRDVRKIRLIENEQRQDLTPLERADGYAELIAKDGFTVEQIAAEVHKSSATIYGLVKLAQQSPPAARAALADGSLPMSTAQLIARIPDPKAREKAARQVLGKAECFLRRWSDDKGPLSLRDTKKLIERDYMIELKKAPFNSHEASLVPSAGACTTCPLRTGNNKELYPDSREDICTSPACYQSKVKAWQERQTKMAKDLGQTVLSGKESEELFPHGSRLAHGADFLDLAEECSEDRSKRRRTYQVLLGKLVPPADVVLAFDLAGTMHRLINKDQARKLLLEKHQIRLGAGYGSTGSRTGPMTDREKAERKKRIEEGRIKAAVEKAILARADQEARQVFAFMGRQETDSTIKWILRVLAGQLVPHAWGLDEIFARRGCKKKYRNERVDELLAQTESMTAPQIMGLMVECVACKLLAQPGGGDEGKALGLALGINPQEIAAEVKAELAARPRETQVAPGITIVHSNGTPAGATPPFSHPRQVVFAAMGHGMEGAGRVRLPMQVLSVLQREGLVTVGDLLDRAAMVQEATEDPGGLESVLIELFAKTGRRGVVLMALHDAFLQSGLRFCRKCFCTSDHACETDDGPCSWVDDETCSACAEVPS